MGTVSKAYFNDIEITFGGSGVDIVNNLTDGGDDKALSAEMGKVLNEQKFSLSPCRVWNDNFKEDRTFEEVDVEAGAYPESFSTRDTAYTTHTISAYTMTGVSRSSAGVVMSSAGNFMLNRNYYADYRRMTIRLILTSASSSLKFGVQKYKVTRQVNTEYTNTAIVDFSTATINGEPMGFAPVAGRAYYITIITSGVNEFAQMQVQDATNDANTKKVTLSTKGMIGAPYVEWVSGNYKIEQLDVSILGDKPTFYLMGDSIVQNANVTKSKRYSELLKKAVPNTVVSCMGGEDARVALLLTTAEIEQLKPACVIDEFFVNGCNEWYVKYMDAWCASQGIAYIHTIPTGNIGASTAYFNCYKYIINNCRVIDFESALCIDGNSASGHDSSLFLDGVHPNDNGSLRMWQCMINELGIFNSEAM